jgi:lysozyme family protein
MGDNFQNSLKLVLVHEGGKVDDPHDRGGRTNQGVTQTVYSAYRHSQNLRDRDVFDMSPVERDEIYRIQYWARAWCDKLPLGIDYAVFDGAVNSGVSQSVKWLQRALGTDYTGQIDGMIGMISLSAVRQSSSLHDLIDSICDKRLAFLKELKGWRRYGKGWETRVEQVRVAAKSMARGSVVPTPQPLALADLSSPKATVSDAKEKPVKAVADAAVGTGVGAGVVSQALGSIKEQLEPFGNVEFVSRVVMWITIAGIVLFVGGLAYRWYAAHRGSKRADALDIHH